MSGKFGSCRSDSGSENKRRLLRFVVRRNEVIGVVTRFSFLRASGSFVSCLGWRLGFGMGSLIKCSAIFWRSPNSSADVSCFLSYTTYTLGVLDMMLNNIVASTTEGTEPRKSLGTWLREISSCSCLTFLPGPAWVLLSKICKDFFSALYIICG